MRPTSRATTAASRVTSRPPASMNPFASTVRKWVTSPPCALQSPRRWPLSGQDMGAGGLGSAAWKFLMKTSRSQPPTPLLLSSGADNCPRSRWKTSSKI
jgi:hypothetical protein